jgi:uncharacterized membrane protein HdeD (DUF308 family)
MLGVLLILVGMIALLSQVIASLATALVIGWLLLFAGIIEIVGAFWSRRWRGFFLHLLSGCCRPWSACCSFERRSMRR